MAKRVISRIDEMASSLPTKSHFKRGLLVLGAAELVIRLSPPLIITRAQADFAVKVLSECLEEAQREA